QRLLAQFPGRRGRRPARARGVRAGARNKERSARSAAREPRPSSMLQVLAAPVRQRTSRAGPPPYSRFALFAARTAIEKQRSSIQPDRRFSMFNRNLLAAIVLAAVSSTALALDADQPAKD